MLTSKQLISVFWACHF